MPSAPSKISEILDRLDEAARDDPKVSIGEALQALGSRSYGPFLIAPALLVLTPVGAIPGVPSLFAAVIILFAVQMALNRDYMWLPGFVKRAGVSTDRVTASTQKLRPVADVLDRWFHGRVEWLTTGPAVRVAAIGCVLLALTVPPLELLPFASAAPMAAIAMYGLALTVKDGLVMLAALALMVAAIGVGFGFLATPG